MVAYDKTKQYFMMSYISEFYTYYGNYLYLCKQPVDADAAHKAFLQYWYAHTGTELTMGDVKLLYPTHRTTFATYVNFIQAQRIARLVLDALAIRYGGSTIMHLIKEGYFLNTTPPTHHNTNITKLGIYRVFEQPIGCVDKHTITLLEKILGCASVVENHQTKQAIKSLLTHTKLTLADVGNTTPFPYVLSNDLYIKLCNAVLCHNGSELGFDLAQILFNITTNNWTITALAQIAEVSIRKSEVDKNHFLPTTALSLDKSGLFSALNTRIWDDRTIRYRHKTVNITTDIQAANIYNAIPPYVAISILEGDSIAPCLLTNSVSMEPTPAALFLYTQVVATTKCNDDDPVSVSDY
jgi:hypothetical protein